MMSEKKWYAIYTKPRSEKRVADLLSKLQIEHFCPAVGISTQKAIRQRKLLESVFGGYIFVRILENVQPMVKQVESVVNFVYWLGSPAAISAEEIDAMRFLMNENGSLLFEKIAVVTTLRLPVFSGPFIDWTGYEAVSTIRSVIVHLPSLGANISGNVSMSRKERVRFIKTSGLPLIPLESPSIQTGS